MCRGRHRGTEAGKPGDGGWGAGGGLSPAGMAGVPWGPVGAEAPHVAGCETTTCVSVTKVLRGLPQELIRRGECGPGRPRGMTMKRKWGARMSLAVGTLLRPGGGRCPGLFPSSRGRGAVVGGGVATPQRGSVPVPWVQTPLGAGTKRPVASSPLHNSPPGACWPLAPAVVGGGARGSAGPLRSPGGPHCPYNATRGGAGSNRARGPRRPSRGGGQGGDRGGGQGVAAGGWRVAGARTAHRRAPPPSSREAQLQGFWGPHPGAFAPPPCGFGVGEGRQRPLAAMTHGA